MPDAAFNPTWSPGGRRFAYCAFTDRPRTSQRSGSSRRSGTTDGIRNTSRTRAVRLPAGLDREAVIGDRSSNLAPPPITRRCRTSESWSGVGVIDPAEDPIRRMR